MSFHSPILSFGKQKVFDSESATRQENKAPTDDGLALLQKTQLSCCLILLFQSSYPNDTVGGLSSTMYLAEKQRTPKFTTEIG